MNRRSPGENFTQSGSGLPPAVVAEICNGVELTLWMKVLSGRVRLAVVSGAILTISKVLTATKLAVPWLLVPPDEVDRPMGVMLPLISTAIGEPVPDGVVVEELNMELVTVPDDAVVPGVAGAVDGEETVAGVESTDGWLPPAIVLVVLEVPAGVTGAEELTVTSDVRGATMDTVTAGTTTSC